MKKKTLIFLIIIFLFGFIVRIYKIHEPIADWHSFRQSDTAAVSKIYAREGIDMLYPKYYDISNVQSGLDNPSGYRFVEFPLYNVFHALLSNTFSFFSFEIWGRLINIFASLASAFAIYLLVRKYANEISARFSLIAFLFLPFSIFYSRSILPDVMMTTSILTGTYFFDKYLEKRRNTRVTILFYILALFFVALAFLLKPFSLFFTFPLVYLAWKKYSIKIFFSIPLWIFAVSAVAPLIWWRYWISQFPEGIPVSAWLFNGNGIRLRPAFFRWILYERITKLILGFSGIIFLLGSFWSLKKKNIFFFLSFAFSSMVYLIIIATGNVQHDYYQIAIIPTISIFVGLGAYEIYKFIAKRTFSIFGFMVVGILFLTAFLFSWNQVKDYFNINDRNMVEAGRRADEILPQNALVIAPYDGSSTLLNMVSRRGWPVFQSSVEDLIKKGADYLIIASPTENDRMGFGRQYEILESSDAYLILRLQ